MPNDILAEYLIDQGLASRYNDGADWPVYVGTLPDSEDIEDNLLAVFLTAGILHGKRMDGVLVQHYGIQIRCRSVDESDGYEKLKEIVTHLLAQHWVSISLDSGEQYRLESITQTSDIVPIALDAKQRTHMTVNLIMACTQI